MKPSFKNDVYFMKLALRLAKLGTGSVHPNPLVGAVLLKNGKILGKGYHKKFGEAHAEANAIRNANRSVEGATLYVTLEPCDHIGKTSRCTDLIVQEKIKEVVIGSMDPNPLVSGKGILRLRRAGIIVRSGVCENECRELNRDYFYWIERRMPYAVLKLAQSVDGKIATSTGESQWISGRSSRAFTQQLRKESDAILVGIQTILKDDPRLNVRLKGTKQQTIKIVLDTALRTPLNAKIFSRESSGKVIIAAGKRVSKHRINPIQKKAEVILQDQISGRVNLKKLFLELGKRGVVKILIEGGGEVAASALADKLVQEVYFFVSPILIGGKDSVNSVGGRGIPHLKNALHLRDWSCRRIGEDFLIHGKI